MANSAGSRKRAKQATKRRGQNTGLRSMVRTAVKKVLAHIEGKNYEGATAAYAVAQPALDRMARKGILSANKAARTKARLSVKIKALQA